MKKAVMQMLRSVLMYILSYAFWAIILSSLHIDACVVQAMSGIYVIFCCWKKERKQGMDYLEACGLKKFEIPQCEIWVLIGLGFSLNCFVGGVMNLLPLGPELSESYREMSSAPVEGVQPVLAFFVIAVAAPVIEEIFFRGTLLRRMAQAINPFYALMMISLIFGLMHGQIIWMIYASVLGLVLGMIYLLYGSIYPSIIVHISFNLVSGIPMLMNPMGLLYRCTYGNTAFRILMAAGGFIGISWILFEFYFPRFMKISNRGECNEK